MKTVSVLDKKFKKTISEKEIDNAISVVAEQINQELDGQNPLFICILNGAFMFASDLMKKVTIPSEITFVKLSSYQDMESTGKVKQIFGLTENVAGRNVVVVEDIVDTGYTMQDILAYLKEKNAKTVKVATCLQKPDALKVDVKVDYIAMKIPNDFIVGYGLDYNGYGRNLKDIYTVIE